MGRAGLQQDIPDTYPERCQTAPDSFRLVRPNPQQPSEPGQNNGMLRVAGLLIALVGCLTKPRGSGVRVCGSSRQVVQFRIEKPYCSSYPGQLTELWPQIVADFDEVANRLAYHVRIPV